MASVFGTPKSPFQKHGGSFRAEDVTMTFGKLGGEGAIVQRVEFSIERNINMLYEIGSSNVYYVGNRRRGTAQLNRIVGGSGSFKQLINTFGNMCTPDDLTLAAGASKCGTGKKDVTYKLLKATLTSIGASVTANDIVITENLGFMFLDLEYTDGANGALGAAQAVLDGIGGFLGL
jgi:hypothetical protein